MHFAVRKNWIFSVHQFIKKDATRVSIISNVVAGGVFLKRIVIKIRHI